MIVVAGVDEEWDLKETKKNIQGALMAESLGISVGLLRIPQGGLKSEYLSIDRALVIYTPHPLGFMDIPHILLSLERIYPHVYGDEASYALLPDQWEGGVMIALNRTNKGLPEGYMLDESHWFLGTNLREYLGL